MSQSSGMAAMMRLRRKRTVATGAADRVLNVEAALELLDTRKATWAKTDVTRKLQLLKCIRTRLRKMDLDAWSAAEARIEGFDVHTTQGEAQAARASLSNVVTMLSCITGLERTLKARNSGMPAFELVERVDSDSDESESEEELDMFGNKKEIDRSTAMPPLRKIVTFPATAGDELSAVGMMGLRSEVWVRSWDTPANIRLNKQDTKTITRKFTTRANNAQGFTGSYEEVLASLTKAAERDEAEYERKQKELEMNGGADSNNTEQDKSEGDGNESVVEPGTLTLVLGSIWAPALFATVLTKLFIEDSVVLVKLSKLRAATRQFYKAVFVDLISDGFLWVLDTKDDFVNDSLNYHPMVDSIHVAHTRRVYERIIAGPGETQSDIELATVAESAANAISAAALGGGGGGVEEDRGSRRKGGKDRKSNHRRNASRDSRHRALSKGEGSMSSIATTDSVMSSASSSSRDKKSKADKKSGDSSSGRNKKGSSSKGPTLCQDPRYEVFYKMMRMGVPKPAAQNKMIQAGLDPAILDMDPDSPAPIAPLDPKKKKQKRKEERQQRMQRYMSSEEEPVGCVGNKTVTAELGCVSPWIIVPGSAFTLETSDEELDDDDDDDEEEEEEEKETSKNRKGSLRKLLGRKGSTRSCESTESDESEEPADWTDAEIEHHARLLVAAITSNGACTSHTPRVLILDAMWPHRQQFVDKVCEVAKNAKPQPMFHPHATENYENFSQVFERAAEKSKYINILARPKVTVPEMTIPELPKPSLMRKFSGKRSISKTMTGGSTSSSQASVSTYESPNPAGFWDNCGDEDEASGPIVRMTPLIVEMRGENRGNRLDRKYLNAAIETSFPVLIICSMNGDNDPECFLRRTRRFVNRSLYGTLSCTLIVHPTVQEHHESVIEETIEDLNYGVVCVNQWAAFAFMIPGVAWGGHRWSEARRLETGKGFTKNEYMLENIDKSVVVSPFMHAAHPQAQGASQPHNPKDVYRSKLTRSFLLRPTVTRMIRMMLSS